jgi:CspA family cold shock protein
MQGTVARIVIDRGFGFIEGENGREFFFHRSALNATDFGELAPGSPVEFEVSNDTPGDQPNEGPRAVNVHLAPGATSAVDNELLPPEKTR